MTIKIDLADSIVVDNEDIIDKKGIAANTVEIEVYVKPRLMSSDHLTYYVVTNAYICSYMKGVHID